MEQSIPYRQPEIGSDKMQVNGYIFLSAQVFFLFPINFANKVIPANMVTVLYAVIKTMKFGNDEHFLIHKTKTPQGD